MQKSYLAKTTIHFIDFKFYVRPGDILVHDTGNQNRLTVFRNGQIEKVVKQDPLGIAAFLKNKFIEDIQDTKPEPKKEGLKVAVKTGLGLLISDNSSVKQLLVEGRPEEPKLEEPKSEEPKPEKKVVKKEKKSDTEEKDASNDSAS